MLARSTVQKHTTKNFKVELDLRCNAMGWRAYVVRTCELLITLRTRLKTD